ncbi:MAG TPA: GntR family transcriptional regulator [Caldilineaceae bacterium]|nr:GntR family transcriptional regulator [Caldilineaceae bacterium]
MRLNRDHPIPLYFQFVELMRERIQSGQLAPGEQLPSMRELSDQTGISRMTVRQGIDYLVRNGLLVVKPGVGTFVAAPKLVHDTLDLLGFSEEMARQGLHVLSRVLEQGVGAAPPKVAGELRLAKGEPVVKIVRLRAAGAAPLLLETNYIPANLCPGLEQDDLAHQSLFELYERRYGLRPLYTRQSLEATTANAYEAELFQTKPGTALLLSEGVLYGERDQPIEYFKAIYRGDRFKFQFQSNRHSLAQNEASAQPVNVVIE